MVKLNAELEKTEPPRFLIESCTENHRLLKSNFEKSVSDLIISETVATTFSKQVKLIIETLDTNLKLLKGLKTTEAKKYSKEVETLQIKFTKVMENGKKVQAIQNEMESFEREKELLKKKKLNFSKAKNMDIKSIQDKLVVLSKNNEKYNDDYKKAKDDLAQHTKDFNEAKHYIFRTFNAHSASIDMRIGDNLDLFKKNLSEFVGGLKITTVPSAPPKEVTLVSSEFISPSIYTKGGINSKANSISASSEEEKSKRLVDICN